jgi:hypothetical protein
MQIVVEFLALIGLILISLLRIKSAARTPLDLFPRWLPPGRRHPALVFLLIGLLAFLASALVTVFTGIPQPAIHDEFSHLLVADTLAHGRLTNPPHPLWKFFETFHVIQQPTYASKYPPAQGLALALGQVIFGLPIVGVWLSVGLACAAICWMLAGWCPLRWAWMGGLVAVVRLVFSGPIFPENLGSTAYWSQSYWGGAVAALGGALVFGALPRILKKQRGGDALWLAVGLALLANSRPLEGLLVSIPVLGVLGFWMVRVGRLSGRSPFRQVVVPMVLVLLPTVMWMGYYNYRLTGDPFRLAYQVHEATYGAAPVFLWQPLQAAPPYHHQTLSEFHAGWTVNGYLTQRSLSGWTRGAIGKINALWLFFVGFLFTPFMVALPFMWRRRKVKFALGVCGLLMAILLTETWSYPHYAAPVTCLVILLLVESLRQARFAQWRGRPIGKSLVRAVIPMLLFSAIVPLALVQPLKHSGWHLERARLLKTLELRPGRHLVIVRYGPNHSAQQEWVYNRADIDAARVVWARGMNLPADRKLLDYFKDRTAWRLQVDQFKLYLTPYPGDRHAE